MRIKSIILVTLVLKTSILIASCAKQDTNSESTASGIELGEHGLANTDNVGSDGNEEDTNIRTEFDPPSDDSQDNASTLEIQSQVTTAIASEADSSTNNINQDETLNSLPETVTPFEMLLFNSQQTNEIITISYKDALSGVLNHQPSFKNSFDEYIILAIPLSMREIENYLVSSNGESLGTVAISPNTMMAENSASGQYSLTVLSSVIRGLKDELILFTNYLLQSEPNTKSADTITSIQQAISIFDELASRLDYAVTENSAVIDPNNSAILIDKEDLKTLDGIFHHIVTRYSSDELFLNHLYNLIGNNIEAVDSEFNLIFSAARIQLENWDGLAALASLKIYSESNAHSAEIKRLNNILDVVKTALLPAILANELANLRLQNQNSQIGEALRLFQKVESLSPDESNFIFREALSTLLESSKTLEIH